MSDFVGRFICIGTGFLDVIKLVDTSGAQENLACELLGFLDDNEANKTRYLYGYSIICNSESLSDFEPEIKLFNSVARTTELRGDICEKFSLLGRDWISLCHATVDRRFSSVGKGCYLAEGVSLGMGVRIDDHAMILNNASIAHDSEIGYCSFVGAGALIQGGVLVKEKVFIGSGAVIAPGVEVGAGAHIAPNSFVVDDVMEGSSILGVPARRIK